MVSVRHPTLVILRRLFTQQATVSAFYDQVGSLNDYPIYFNLVYLSTELKPTESFLSKICIECVRMYRASTEFEEEEEGTCAGYKNWYKIAFRMETKS